MRQTKGLTRNTIDKYYTKEAIVNLCFATIKETIEINKNDLIIEPSAGNGVFIKGIKLLTSKYNFYDIEPENNEIIKQDFLDYSHNNQEDDNKIHIIGNPPFGRQSSLAIKFIKKSCEFCDSISFILPKSFKKDSLKKAFALNFHLLKEIDLPEKSFLVDNIEYDVPCIFQIWEKRNNNRIMKEKLEPVNFKFVKKEENPDNRKKNCINGQICYNPNCGFRHRLNFKDRMILVEGFNDAKLDMTKNEKIKKVPDVELFNISKKNSFECLGVD